MRYSKPKRKSKKLRRNPVGLLSEKELINLAFDAALMNAVRIIIPHDAKRKIILAAMKAQASETIN